MNDLVSVIIPIYNAEKYLADTLESVIRQTHENLEIICVLDAPTDSSEAIARDFALRDARIKIIKSERSIEPGSTLGPGRARNAGAELASGEWVHFMDADDLISPQFYERMLRACSRPFVDAAACSVYYEKKPRRSVVFKRDEILFGRAKFSDTRALRHSWAWRWLIRRDLWRRCKISFPNLRELEDRPAIIRMLFYARAAATCGGATYFYKNRPNSILNAKYDSEKKRLQSENRRKGREITKNFMRRRDAGAPVRMSADAAPIDLVYMWADGSDPKWLAKKNAALAAAGMAPRDPNNGAHRAFDNDELKYSLRSAARFAPWINHVYIVSDGQVPAWLNTENPRVSIVGHSEIMPQKCLPTFNTSAMEFYLHNIRGLSERFIYANDDMFFGRPAEPEYFFGKRGRPVIRIKGDGKKYLSRKFAGQYDQILANSKKLAHEIFGARAGSYDWHPSHNIDPYLKSAMAEAAQDPRIAAAIAEMSARPLRDSRDIQRVFFHEYLIGTGRANVKKYTPLARALAAATMREGEVPVMRNARRLSRMKRLPRLFCINDSGLCAADDAASREFFSRTFPDKSEFEK
ncbi:MAG: Stealth CR1 domain-containing protein [Rickettsiales bacterium]|jgi:glycosyltransferase involved in cell wall biosynthesis|nr:Stealth CR1 domain-containing protein [Rickettsiales bacterium]